MGKEKTLSELIREIVDPKKLPSAKKPEKAAPETEPVQTARQQVKKTIAKPAASKKSTPPPAESAESPEDKAQTLSRRKLIRNAVLISIAAGLTLEYCDTPDPHVYLGTWQLPLGSMTNTLDDQTFKEFTIKRWDISPEKGPSEFQIIDQKKAPLIMPVVVEYANQKRYAGIYRTESQDVLVIWNAEKYSGTFLGFWHYEGYIGGNTMIGLSRFLNVLRLGFGKPANEKSAAYSDSGELSLKDVNGSYDYAILK